jgi:hypothetical protein
MSETAPMPEASSLPRTEAIQSEEIYRPVSGLAIAAFVLAVVFGAVVASIGAAGLVGRTPVLLSGWLFLFPAGSVALSILAQRQIRRSEGTRAGMRLAVWGMWLSVIFGLGYGAHSVATYFTIRHQVEDFLLNPEKGFVAKLKRPDGVNAAFLLTQPPDARGNVSDQDTRAMELKFKHNLVQFRTSRLARVVHQDYAALGGEAQVHIQSVSSLRYEQEGFALEVMVTAVTPERTAGFSLTLRSKESAGIGIDKWYIDLTRIRDAQEELTPVGQALDDLRKRSHMFAAKWLRKLREDRDFAGALKDTLNPSDFSPGGKGIKKDIGDKNARALIDRLFDPAVKAEDLKLTDVTLGCCLAESRMQAPGGPPPAYWGVSKDKKHLQVFHDVNLSFDNFEKGGGRIMCMGHVVVERADTGLFTVDLKHPPEWHILRVELTSAHTRESGAPGKGPGPG